MRCAWFSLLLGSTLMLSGCWLDFFYAKKDGKPSTAEVVQAAVKAVPIYGDLIAYGIGAVGTIFGLGTHVVHRKKHKRSAAEIASLKARIPTPPPSAPAT